MATKEAQDTKAGELYRTTRRRALGGVYFTRAKKTAAKLLAQLRKRGGRLTGREAWVMAMIIKSPDVIVMVEHQRGQVEGERYEVKRITVVPADYTFRVVQSKPGFNEGGN